MDEQEFEAGEVKPESEREAGRIAYLENIDKLRQRAGITAAMLRDGRARQMVELFESHQQPSILVDDLRMAWRHAVRALNYCENSGLKDNNIPAIVCSLSQELEFAETMNS